MSPPHWRFSDPFIFCPRSAEGGGNIALMVIGAIVFIVVGIFAFITAAKGRQSRPLGACVASLLTCGTP